MSHVCPECHGANVRRTSTPMAELSWRDNFCSRYRCRDCMHEFWGIRRKTYAAGITLAFAILLAVIAVVVMDLMSRNP